MSTALLFLEECNKFWKWIDDPQTSVDSLETYAESGIIPEAVANQKPARMSPQRNPNIPPQGDFTEGSMWFHPVTQEMHLYTAGAWVRSRNNTTKKKLSPPEVKKVANSSGIHCYYQDLTKQYKFSLGEHSWTATVEVLDSYIDSGEHLEEYFRSITSFILDNCKL